MNSKMNVRMAKKGDLSNFERGIVVGARQQPFLEFTKNGVKREQHPVCSGPLGENALLMLEVRGEWAD